ncbi:Phosphoenolpyruvate-protein phosphotransferase [Mycoplasmopsis edwardii]|uniref:Phosphoenolpyruvate-protein phosphotransferase n=4 Tax=Mycoplasmopsis edwardii TaxID=53558 RepID=A0A3B0PU71_9BACT|nr:Phosphoenolpyruvate-protein phosphotransferase [Mycoplasmopsis edwardii]
MCGEMAGDKRAVPLLLGLGLDEFSMSSSNILATRELINSLEFNKMQELAEKAINLSTMGQVEELLKENL